MKRMALLLVSAIMVSGTALASGTGTLRSADFKKADLNDSGGLSRVELGKVSGKGFDVIRNNFDAIDTDRDGQVSLAEYQAYVGVDNRAAASPSSSSRADQCHPDCGRVIAMDRYKVEGKGSAVGMIAGGLAGGLLGNQVGGGTGKTIATVGGAAGGAYAGNLVEKKLKSKDMVKVKVKLDNGQQQDFDFEADKSPVANGDRVQIRNGQVSRYTGQ